MLYYPQLSSGAAVQYPVNRRRTERAIVNTLEDGSRFALNDPTYAFLRWTLSYTSLSDDEVQILSAFFASVEGRLTPFSFFDPAGNLLGWSEALDQNAWQKSTYLTLESGIYDLLGTQRAARATDTSGAALSLSQEVDVPGAVTCCWSFYARGDSPATLQLMRSNGSGNASSTGLVNASWRRFSLVSALSGGDSSVFGVQLPAGATIDLFGFQVDAQPGPSQYVPTVAAGGVYPKARFDSDTLTITAVAPNESQCDISILTPVKA